MVSFKILAGGWATYVVTYLFNADTNELSVASRSQTGSSPSWLTLSNKDSSILYTTNEIGPIGNLQSFKIADDGTISLADTVQTGGNGPTFAAQLSTGEVTAMNYGSPNVAIIPTSDSDPTKFSTDYRLVDIPVGSGQTSHPHNSLEYKDELFIADLGMDTVWRLGRDGPPGYWKIQGRIDQAASSGPRHMATIDDVLFVLHEVDNTLTAQLIVEPTNATSLPAMASVNIAPPTYPNGANFAAGEILIPPKSSKFPTQHIYVSNRNIGTTDSQGDAIAIYEWNRSAENKGEFKQTGLVFTQLDQIRGMMHGNVEDGSEEYIVASANVVADGETVKGGTIILQRVQDGGNLTIVARNRDELTRTSMVWL